ncbi:MAG: SLC13 family permease [Planctomycetota bacterium]
MTSWKFWLGILVPLLVLFIPTELLPFKDLTLTEHRLLAIFLFAVLFWVLEPIPVFATSVAIITLQLVFISNRALIWFRQVPEDAAGAAAFGTLVGYQDLFHTFAHPIILLFMGGFFLAAAATKFQLDQNLARFLLRPFGNKPAMVMLGLMVVTALFSMFMSNTATTAMMLAVLAPVLKLLDEHDGGRIAFILAIPFAANIGGIGTPIGTPPNAVAAGILTGPLQISFAGWMSFSVPYVAVMLLVAWFALCLLFPIKSERVDVNIKSSWLTNWEALTVYAVFAVTVLLWLTGWIHGMTSHIVAMIPVAIFVATKIINVADLKRFSWDVLWLVSGGIALGVGLQETGLSSSLVNAVPFEQMPVAMIAMIAAFLGLLMSTFMSNTATANLLLPIMVALGTSVPELNNPAGTTLLIVAVTYACSLAMGMPISTPPNALAHATGLIETRHMLRSGVLIGFVGLLIAFGMLKVLGDVGYFG